MLACSVFSVFVSVDVCAWLVVFSNVELLSIRPNNTLISPVDVVILLVIQPFLPSAVFTFIQSFNSSITSISSFCFTSFNSIELINGIILSFTSSNNFAFSFSVVFSVSVLAFSSVLFVPFSLFSIVFTFSSSDVSFVFVMFAASFLFNSIKSFLIYPVICLYFTLYHWSSSFNISTSSPCDANSNTLESVFACSLSFAVSTKTFPVFAAKLIFIKSKLAIAISVMNIMLFILSFIFIVFLLLILLY